MPIAAGGEGFRVPTPGNPVGNSLSSDGQNKSTINPPLPFRKCDGVLLIM